MTEKREQYQVYEPKHMPVDAEPEPAKPWQPTRGSFDAGFQAALRYMHGALFLRDWDYPLSAQELKDKIRAACLAGELGGGDE